MTEEQVHEKVQKLFDNNELTIRASRVVVPADHLDYFVPDTTSQMLIILNMKSFRLLIPSQVARSVRDSLKNPSTNKEKLCAKYDLTNYAKHINLKEICKYGNKQIGLSEVFDDFIDRRKDAFTTADEFKSMISYFFRYMPFVTVDKYCEFTANDFQTELQHKINVIHDKLEMITVDYQK